jgi:hypothetical protein
MTDQSSKPARATGPGPGARANKPDKPNQPHRVLTEAEIDSRAREIRECLRLYMLTADFEVRALCACEEIQQGGLRTAAELAEALGLPEPFLAVALEQHAKKFIADHGGLN